MFENLHFTALHALLKGLDSRYSQVKGHLNYLSEQINRLGRECPARPGISTKTEILGVATSAFLVIQENPELYRLLPADKQAELAGFLAQIYPGKEQALLRLGDFDTDPGPVQADEEILPQGYDDEYNVDFADVTDLGEDV